MVYVVIAAYVILAVLFLVAEGKKQLVYATLAAALSSAMALVTHLKDEPLWKMLVYFGVGVVFAFFTWAALSDDKKPQPNKNRAVAAVLALLLGGLGAHKYYLGQYGRALLYLLLSWTGISVVLSVIEFVYLLFIPKETFCAKFHISTAKPTPTATAAPARQPVSVPAAQPVAQHVPAPVVVHEACVDVGTENTSISEEMAEKYKAVQFVLDDALQKANAIQVFGEQEGNELAAIREALKKLNEDFHAEIERLKNASEWDRFCIAFFGETNAGKSTIIESLRILYDEESKRVEAMEQKAEYYHLMKQHCADYRDLIASLEEVNVALKEHYGKKKAWLTYVLVGAISAVVGLVVGVILAN